MLTYLNYGVNTERNHFVKKKIRTDLTGALRVKWIINERMSQALAVPWSNSLWLPHVTCDKENTSRCEQEKKRSQGRQRPIIMC
jgi:hypothetical protein